MQEPANILQPAAQNCNGQHSADGTSSAHQPLPGCLSSAAAASLNRSTARTAAAAVLMVSSLGAAAVGFKSHDINRQQPSGEAPACQAAASGPDDNEAKPAGTASAEPVAPPPLPPSFLVARAALTMAAALATANLANGHQKSG